LAFQSSAVRQLSDLPSSEPVLFAQAAVVPLKVLIVVPTVQDGAADVGAVELARILASAGHRPIVFTRGGRLEADILANGGEVVHADVASKNPAIILRNALLLRRLARERGCNAIHAHARAPAWSAYLAARMTGVPFLTTWYKGFGEQNPFKRLYNSVMAHGDRVVAVGDQIAELINERYGTPWARIAVVPASVDCAVFDPAKISRDRIEATRRSWGAGPSTKVVVVIGRVSRRKGHHVVVRAARRLKELGVKDFMCVIAGADQGRTSYGGELWDLVLATDTADVVRLVGSFDDPPAVYAAATVAVSAAVQPEGLQRALLEAQAMARPVVVSDLGAGPEVVLAPPAVPEDRMTGLRFSAGDDAALATALIRLFTIPEAARRAIGARGRAWMRGHFNDRTVVETTLRLYGDIARHRKDP
jgi:glycosyltransferase involved in cell wall biosynthesis